MEIERVNPKVKAAMDSWFEASKEKPIHVMKQEWDEIFGTEGFDSFVRVQYAFIRLEMLQRYTETEYRFSREALEKLIPDYLDDKQAMIDGLIDPSKTWQQILKDICKKNKS